MKLAVSRKNLWEKLPRSLKAAVGRALHPIPLEILLGRRFRETRAWLREAERWTPKQVETYQTQQIRRICALAQEKSPFYREAFARASFDAATLRSPRDLQRLPTIDKTVVLANLEALLTRSMSSRDVDYTTTGGTGGQPLRFYIDAGRSAIEYAFLTAGWQRAGFSLGTPVAVLRGRIVRQNARGTRHEYDPLLRQHYFSNFHTRDIDLSAYIATIRSIGPCFLHAYPSSAAALARFLRRSGTPAPSNILGILVESEIVYPEQRRQIESAFGCRLFSSYGHTEKLVLATECEKSHRYHVWPTYGYFELLDESGTPITTPGLRGEIVGTGFINTVMPFIRYRTGDHATYVGDHCPDCGRAGPLIEDITGHRTQEYLVASDGSEISWTALNMHDDTFDRVRQFQFAQVSPGSAILRLVATEGFQASDAERIRKNLDKKFDGRLSFSIEFTDVIPLSPRGKAIYIVNRSPLN